ncbi:hypothetical protein PLO_0761 [Pediococcus acidilactici NGRI 0510Q]|nr:hypothetical protein PLO_0761 [Pediococcus acidilactici NGRI 0510Q]SJM51309.1 hypothetical protein FM124_07410 [Pediococcus acidilactici]
MKKERSPNAHQAKKKHSIFQLRLSAFPFFNWILMMTFIF